MNARPMSSAALLLEGALYATSPAQKANFERAHAEVLGLIEEHQALASALVAADEGLRAARDLINLQAAEINRLRNELGIAP